MKGKPKTGGRKKDSRKARSYAERKAQQAVQERLKELTGTALDILEEQLHDPEGDRVSAARLVLQKTQPDAKNPGITIDLPELAEAPTLVAKAEVLGNALADGRITVEQFQLTLRALESAAKLADSAMVAEVFNLVKQGKPLPAAVREVDERYGQLKVVNG